MVEGDSNLRLASRIPRHAAGGTVLDYLTQRFRYRSAAAWRDEIEAGRVRLEGRPAKPSDLLRAGVELVWETVHREPFANVAVRVLQRGAGFVLVDKPAHLPAHADGPFVRRTLVQISRDLVANQRLQLVHRLDRETSGLCVLAGDDPTRRHLQRQFAEGAVAKTYLAIVRGELQSDFTVDAPIGRAAASSIALRRSAAADARDPQPARTEFAVIARGGGRTLLRCHPATGRTHQIRVHLEACGAPLLGDKLYGHPDAHYLAFVERVKREGDARRVPAGEPDRHLLHASDLAFTDPADGTTVRCHCEPPADFTAWLPPDAAP